MRLTARGALWQIEGVRAAPMVCPAESSLPGSAYANFVVRNFRRGGNDAPTTAREAGLAALWVSRQLRCPKVSKGRAESPLVRPLAHTPCPGWGLTRRLWRGRRGLQPYGVFICFGRRTEGVQGASGKPPACIDMRQLCRKKFPAKGNDAPTTARVMGLPPRGGIVLSFDATESTKESMRHGDSGKKPFTAHF